MGSGIFYSKIANTKKNVKKSRFSRMLFFAGILLFTLPFQGKAQAPVFVNGSPETLTVCENSSAVDISAMLAVNGVVGNTETWTVTTPPSSGGILGGTMITGGSYSDVVIGGSLTPVPGTLTYAPAAGSTTSETFTIQVSDINGLATTTFNVTINPTPDVDPLSIPAQAVCNGASTIAVTPTGSVGGTTYDWTNDNISIGLAASGTGN